jgi:hypothetical protein
LPHYGKRMPASDNEYIAEPYLRTLIHLPHSCSPNDPRPFLSSNAKSVRLRTKRMLD